MNRKISSFCPGNHLNWFLLLALFLFAVPFAQGRSIRPNPESGLLLMLETKLGKPLSFEQRKQISEATANYVDALKECQKPYTKDIAEITGLAEENIQGLLPQIGQRTSPAGENLLPKIEAKLNRKLTDAEFQKIREADQRKKEAMKPAREKYVRRVAEITGLSEAEVDGMTPLISQQRGGKPMR